MREASTELPDSLIPLVIKKAERIGHSLRLLSAAAQLELSDIALDPRQLDDVRQQELARLGNEVLEFLHQGYGLLKDLVDVGELSVEENGSGLPLKIVSPPAELPALGIGEPESPSDGRQPESMQENGGEQPIRTVGTESELSLSTDEAESPNDDPVSDDADEDSPKEADEVKAASDPFSDAQSDAQSDEDSRIDQMGEESDKRLGVDIQIGPIFYDSEYLGLTTRHEVDILQLMPKLEGRPITRGLMTELGFFSDAKTEAARRQAYAKTMPKITAKLNVVTGQVVIERAGVKSTTHYLVRQSLKVDGLEVIPSREELKKK